MDLTTFIAIYGALLSTIAVGWNIYNASQDKPKIRVITNFGFMNGSNLKKIFLFIKAINKGRRPTTLSLVGIRCEENDLINIKNNNLPFELKEGKSHSEWFDVEELKNKPCSFGWYKDETGKMYKSKSIRKKINNYFSSIDSKSKKTFKGELVN